MGQAKQRKAEIEQLKAEGDGTKYGIFMAYEPKDFKPGEVYPTLALYLTKKDIKAIKEDSALSALSTNTLSGAPFHLFNKFMNDLAKPEVQASKEFQMLSAGIVKYLMTFQSWNFSMSLGDMGCFVTIKEYDGENPNGGHNGGTRFNFAIRYDDWLEQVKEIQSSPAKITSAFSGFFSNDPAVRFSSSLPFQSSAARGVNVMFV